MGRQKFAVEGIALHLCFGSEVIIGNDVMTARPCHGRDARADVEIMLPVIFMSIVRQTAKLKEFVRLSPMVDDFNGCPLCPYGIGQLDQRLRPQGRLQRRRIGRIHNRSEIFEPPHVSHPGSCAAFSA